MAGTTETSRRDKPVIEPVCAVGEAEGSEPGLAARLVQDVDAVTPAMSTGDRRRLSVKAHSQTADIAKLAHGALLSAESVDAHAHGDGAVDTTVYIAARSEARGLEGEHLVRCELLLVESLLLLLQSLNLILDGNLQGV